MNTDTSHPRQPNQIAALVAGVLSLLVILTSGIVTVAALTTLDPSTRCRADEKTLQVAIEAYIASTDRAPRSQGELVDAGFIRKPFSTYDIHEQSIVVAFGSPCTADPTFGTFAAANASSVNDAVVASTGADTSVARACSDVATAFDRLDGVDGSSAKRLSDELHAIATLVRADRASTQDAPLRSDLNALANLLTGMATVVGLLDEHSGAADVQTRAAIAALTEAIAGYMRVIHTSEIMTTLVPTLAASCGTGFTPAPELVSAVEALDGALTAFLATDLGRRPEFSMLADMSEQAGTLNEPAEPHSSMAEEFNDCLYDVEAATLGDNDGCDALYRGCSDGDMAACDDLYSASFPGSNYSVSGATCGGRTQPGGRGYAGKCEEIKEP